MSGATQSVSTSGNWHQFRTRLEFISLGTVRFAGTAGSTVVVDDLVLQPVGAQLTSYTYDPLRGLTSQTDAAGRTVYYEYDALGRLVRTRDEQGRLLSQQAYHYARPQ